MRNHKGFIDLEKVYNRVNREALWQVLRMYDMGRKLLSGIKSLYVHSSACVRAKWGESDWFRIESGVRQECIKFLWIFNVYMNGVKMGVESEIPGRWKRVEIAWPLVCR